MIKYLTLFISYRYSYKRTSSFFGKILSIIILFSISISLISWIIIISVMNGLENKINNYLLKYIPHIILTNNSGYLKYKDNFYIKNIKKYENIKHIRPIIISKTIIQNKNNLFIGTMLGINIDKKYPSISNLFNIKKKLKFGKYNIILDKILAKKINANIGDKINIIPLFNVNKMILKNIFPITKEFNIVGLFNSNSIDNGQFFINQKEAANLLDYPNGYITGWILWLKNPLIIDFINKKYLPKYIIQKDWREQYMDLFNSIKIEKNIICFLFILIVIFSILNITTSLNLLIIEKKREVSLLKIMGMKNKQIFNIFILHSIIIGFIGTLLGDILGVIITKKLNLIISILHINFNNIYLPVSINYIHIIILSILSIFLSFFVSIYPTYKSLNFNILDQIKNE